MAETEPAEFNEWISPAQPTHAALADMATWDAAQRMGGRHGNVRDPEMPTRRRGRRYKLRSRLYCSICHRRMTGNTIWTHTYCRCRTIPACPAATSPTPAFGTAVAHLATRLGGAPGGWTWGRLHTRYFPSLTGASGLGYGPRASSGDAWTVDAAEGGLESSIGPSWRMIIGFPGSGGSSTAEGVYPGGQSENPASPWYANLITDWWDGRYLPMPGTAGAGFRGHPLDAAARRAPAGGQSWLICGNSAKRGATGSAFSPAADSAGDRRLARRVGWGSWDGHRTARCSARRGLRCGSAGGWLSCVAGAVAIAVTADFGLWFVPFVAGLVTGLGAQRAGWRLRHTVPAVLVMAAAGWGAPLLWQAVRGAPVGATARVVAALAGLPPHAMIGVVFTLLIAALQAVRRPVARLCGHGGFPALDEGASAGEDGL